MKAILQNSLLARALFRLREWYHEGAIAGFFGKIRAAYPYSRFRRVWEGFCSAPSCTAANSGYARLLAALRRVMADSEIGIVLMTEKLIDTCPAMVYRYKLTQKRPLIVEIPDRHGEGDVSQTIEKYVSEAIGVKL